MGESHSPCRRVTELLFLTATKPSSTSSYCPGMVNWTCWLRKWGKDQVKRVAQGIRLILVLRHHIPAKNTSPSYIHPQNIWSRQNHFDVSYKCFSTDSSCWVIYPRQANINPTLPAFRKYLQSLNSPELHTSRFSKTMFTGNMRLQ